MTENIINQNNFNPIVTAEGAFFFVPSLLLSNDTWAAHIRRRIKITRFGGANVMQYSA